MDQEENTTAKKRNSAFQNIHGELSHVDRTVLSMSREELQQERQRILRHSLVIKTNFGNLLLVNC